MKFMEYYHQESTPHGSHRTRYFGPLLEEQKLYGIPTSKDGDSEYHIITT